MKKYILIHRIACLIFVLGILVSFLEYSSNFSIPLYNLKDPYVFSTVHSYVCFIVVATITNLTIPAITFNLHKKGTPTNFFYYLTLVFCGINTMFFGFQMFASPGLKLQIYNCLNISLINNGLLSLLSKLTISFVLFMFSNLLFFLTNIISIAQRKKRR